MKEHFYPDLIRSLPEADIAWPGLQGWMLGNDLRQAVFMESDRAIDIGEHSHCAQVCILLKGALELTIEGKVNILKPGDVCFIPAGARHSAKSPAGFAALDIFEDPKRYQAKQ